MYTKTIWKDQKVENERTYEFIKNSDGSYFVQDSFGVVEEIGTPVNAKNMNNIENGIYEHEGRIAEIENKNLVTRENASSKTGSQIKPIYINESGVAAQCSQSLDGNWIFLDESINVLTSKETGTTSINLSQQGILPEDNNYYELFITAYNHNKSEQVVAIDLYSDINTKVVCSRAAKTAEYNTDTFGIIISPNHMLYKHLSYSVTNASYVTIQGYRRLGQEES